MQSRIKFKNEIYRKDFFSKIFYSFHISSQKELLALFNMGRSNFDRYKRGIHTIPLELYLKFVTNFTKEEKVDFQNKIEVLDYKWGRVKGGVATYKNHAEIFNKGRQKAIAKSKERANKFDLNLPLSKDLSYFIGLFIAEGFTNKYCRYYLTQFTAHRLEDEFYKNKILSIAENLFKIQPKLKYEKKVRAIRVNLYSKSLFLLLTERFKIKRGVKSSSVLIPDEIIRSGADILFECIAGIYDGECCVFFDKRKQYAVPYPRIDLHMVNPQILKQISEIFNKYNIKHSISGNFERILIYGKEKIIGFRGKVKLRNNQKIEALKTLI